jgi:hypothetical protein
VRAIAKFLYRLLKPEALQINELPEIGFTNQGVAKDPLSNHTPMMQQRIHL